MAEIENNQVNIHGVHPGYDMESLRVYPRRPSESTQVIESDDVDDGTTIIYTVPANKVFYFTNFLLTIYNDTANLSYVDIFVRDGSDVFQYYTGLVGCAGGEYAALTHAFIPPIEVPAGYDVCGLSPAADVWLDATIYGFIL